MSTIEQDCHGTQDVAYKMMRHLNSTERDTVKINNISEENWITHYNKLWTNEDEDINPTLATMADIDSIKMEELDNALGTFKNKKTSPGIDDINIEVLKCMPDKEKIFRNNKYLLEDL